MGPERLVLGVCAALAVLLGVAVPASSDDGTAVSPPSQQQIDDARNAMQRINQIQQGKQAAAPAASVPQEEAAVVSGGTSRFGQADWWMVGAGAFLLLVMVELVRGIRWRPRPRTS